MLKGHVRLTEMKISSNKYLFYFYYLYYKLFLFKDVKVGARMLYYAEFAWLMSKFSRYFSKLNKDKFLSYCETRFGKFNISPDLISNITVSPSFERLDINYLFNLIEKDVQLKKTILFVDIGAYFGLYTVAVGNKFKKYKDLKIVTFEPGTEYISRSTLKLLSKNIQINKLENVTLYRVGLGSKNSIIPDKRGIKTKKLDSILSPSFSKKFNSIYIKLDVDGSEKDVLEGAKIFINRSEKTTLLIEDFVKYKVIVKYLKEKKFKFIKKLTPYNSFWVTYGKK